MNFYTLLILTLLLGSFTLTLITELLNIKNIKTDIPIEFKKVFDKTKYKKSQNYLKTTTKFSLIKQAFSLITMLLAIFLGLFNFLDLTIRILNLTEIQTGLIFFLILIIVSLFISLPFNIYSTFHIEKKFGFNKTTPKTFILDLIKSLILILVIGCIVLYLVLLFFNKFRNLAWIYAWTAITAIQLTITFIAPVLIMPLFNKFTPLEDNSLKTKINKLTNKLNFKIKGVYTIDGSRRSTKSNAFFTGFGKFKRIALFDTLIKNHTHDEIVSVLAHEIGHYKKHHIIYLTTFSIFTTGVSLFFVSLFLNNQNLFAVFKMHNISIHVGLIIAGILYIPISEIFGIINNILSRHFEYEADQYAVDNFKKKPHINALKKLSVDNLSNLTPHPLKVFTDYSHPPVLDRIKKIKAL